MPKLSPFARALMSSASLVPIARVIAEEGDRATPDLQGFGEEPDGMGYGYLGAPHPDAVVVESAG